MCLINYHPGVLYFGGNGSAASTSIVASINSIGSSKLPVKISVQRFKNCV